MQFSSGIIFGLLILFPGICFYISIFYEYDKTEDTADIEENNYSKNNYSRISLPGPPPNSIQTVFIIGVGSLFAHWLGALLILLNNCYVLHHAAWFHVEPDIYGVQLKGSEFGAYSLASGLLWTLFLCILMYGLGRILLRLLSNTKRLYRLKFGSFADLHWNSREENQILVGYVLTQSMHNSTRCTQIIGYEGTIKELVHDRNEVRSIHLVDCVPFYLVQTSGNLRRQVVGKPDDVIPYLYLPKEDIRNIAFTIYEVDT